MRDKNTLPVDMVYELLTHSTLYGSLRDKFRKRFSTPKKTLTWDEEGKKIAEFRKEILDNPNPHILRILKSHRLTYKLVERLKQRMEPELEKVFFDEQKDTGAYYFYCQQFNIIVEEFNQIVTEVALECDNVYLKEDYLEKILEKRKSCKEFIEQHIRHLEISPTDTIENLIKSLNK